MLAIFALVLLIGFASANLIVSPISLNATIGSSNSTSFTIYNNDTTDSVNIASYSLTGNQIANNKFTLSIVGTITNNTTESFSITINAGSISAGTYSENLTINTNDSIGNYTIPINVNVQAPTVIAPTLCTSGIHTQNISITDFSINNNGEGDDDDWYLLDDVEIEVEVSNNANHKISDDIVVEIYVFSGNTDVTDDFNFKDTKITIGSIKEDDEEIVTFVLNEVPADIEEGNYNIRVIAYIKGDLATDCDEDSDSTDVTNPFDEGVVPYGDIFHSYVNAIAGENIEIDFDLVNLAGDKEEEVLVVLYNKELGIYKKYNLNNFKDGKSESVNMILDIPANATTKTYKIDVETFFDYDDGDVLDEDSYDQNSYDDLDEDYNVFTITVKVTGTVDTTKPTIMAKLNSTAQIGKDLVVEISLFNNADQIITPTVYAEGYESWADFGSISPTSLSIAKQQTGKTYLTLTPTKDGQQTFNVKVLYNGKVVEQPVTVTIASDSGWFSVLAESAGTVAAYLIVAIAVLIALILIILLIRAIWNSPVGKIISYIIIVVTVILLFILIYYLV